MSKTKQAVLKQQEARVLRSRGRASDHLIANALEREAQSLLTPESTELVLGEVLTPYDDDRCLISNTLENPDGVSVDASSARMDLLADANVLELGVDAADSIGAANSIEKMLAHQMAASHTLAMRLASRAQNDDLPTLEQARLTNASSRMMDSFNTAIATFQRLRSGGRQRVIVQHQHVTVEGGAQAVVGGPLAKNNE
jgi:hypothetical protein